MSLALPVWFLCPLSTMSYRCDVESPAGCQAGIAWGRRGVGSYLGGVDWLVCPVIAPYRDFSQDLNSEP